MAFNGGDVFEVTWNHPTLGDGVFFVKANEETTLDPGGFRTEDDADAIAGNGQPIKKITRKRWSFEAPFAWDMNVNNEIEDLRALAADPADAQFTVSHNNGTVWTALGTVVGDIPGNMLDSMIPIKLSGGGVATKIVG